MNTAITDLAFGDSGKGKISDILSPEHDFTIRYSGGANAGHTIVVDGKTSKYHLLPSGGKCRVLTHGMVIDPRQLCKEIKELDERRAISSDWDLSPATEIYISDGAHAIMPWHIYADARKGGKIGTTVRGIGPAYADKMHRWNAIRMGDLLDKLESEKLERFFSAQAALYPSQANSLYQQYLEAAKFLQPYITDTGELLRQAVKDGKNLLFEGAQGIMLDVDFGTYPYVTSSAVGPAAIPQNCGLPNLHLDRIIGVVKAYSTRVGGGPFPSEINEEVADEIREIGKEYGTTTGRPRRIGWFDADLVKYAVECSGVTELALMHVDTLYGFSQIGIRINGETRDIKGWFAIGDISLRGFIDTIEEHVGVPVKIISYGPDRKETIFL